MIRRKFMKFAPKEHNDEKVKKTLEKHNVPTFEGTQPTKFGQFGTVAKDLSSKAKKNLVTPEGGHVAAADKAFSWQQKAIYGGGTGTSTTSDPRNPYAVAQPKGNPYASGGANPYGAPPAGNNGAGNPYASAPAAGGGASNPYGGDAYSGASYGETRSSSSTPAAPRGNSKPYGGADELDDSYDGAFAAPGNAYNGNSRGGYDPGMPRPGPRYAPGTDAVNNQEVGDSFGTPLTRAQTNQSTTSTVAARNALFGAAPRNVARSSAAPGGVLSAIPDDDELNHTVTELQDEEEDEELQTSRFDRSGGASSGASVYGGAAGSIRGNDLDDELVSGVPPRQSQPAFGAVPEGEELDELNQMPSEFAPAAQPGYGGGQGFVSGQQLFEDSEDEDVDYVKRELRQTKQDSVESTRRALQIAAEAETSGRNALGMLGDQGERLGNAAKTVHLTTVQARTGEANADELLRLNRSIFIPNVSNPFNSRRRNQMLAQRLQSEQVYDQLERDALENEQRASEQRVADGLNGSGVGYSEMSVRARMNANRDNPERKMYQFEADSDDDALEDELEQNLEGISDASKRLHGLSLKINEEVSEQNTRIEQMGGRVDTLDHRLHRSTAKMATIN